MNKLQRYEHIRHHLEAFPFACQCHETLQDSNEDGTPFIRFHCRLPKIPNCLIFDCQAPSCGALELNRHDDDNDNVEENHVVDEWNALEEGGVDPHMFDAGYTLAGRTGFQVWAGARLLLEFIMQQSKEFDDPLRVIELGAGVGLVGSALATTHQCSEVLLTDLPTLVEHSIEPNLILNQRRFADQVAMDDKDSGRTLEPPEWLFQRPVQGSGATMYRFGNSFVATSCLDWTRPVREQVCLPARTDVDLILASDCVWLVSMLNSLLDTVDSIMGSETKFLLSLQKREIDGTESPGMFTTVESVLDAINARSWKWTCVAWKPVRLVDGQESEAFVFEITR